jgi:SAM-dependent methyltransferase
MPSTTTTSSRVDVRTGRTTSSPTRYDDVADAYDRLIRPKYERIARHVARTVAAGADLDGAVVLELSAGTGALTHLMAPLVTHYVASDVSRPMLDVARRRDGERVARVAWLRADVEAVPLPSHLFDVVVSSLGPVQDTETALAEARRMLAPGGRFFACTWGDDYAELDLLQAARRRLDVEPRPVTRPDALLSRLAAGGFHDVALTSLRLPVAHASLSAYLDYRKAFGTMPVSGAVTPEQMLESLAAAAAAHLDQTGRVILDWHLLLASGTA